MLPYKRDGELLQVKRISTERPDGKKVIMAEGDCEPCLFGWQALDAGVRAVVLCEGEIDCMSYAQYGISALTFSGSVPDTLVSSRNAATTTDNILLATFFSVDKDGFLATNGSTLTIQSNGAAFTATTIKIIAEQ